MKTVLVLNAGYQPLGVIDWKRAITLYFLDKVDVLEYYDDFELRTINQNYKCPMVIRTRDYGTFIKKFIRFSKENVYNRDDFTCQYCFKVKNKKELTLDHIIPKSKGGVARWENVVTCCKKCNQWKSNLTLEEAGMSLRKKPVKPIWETAVTNNEATPEKWKCYLK